jgi:hypothetical protein
MNYVFLYDKHKTLDMSDQQYSVTQYFCYKHQIVNIFLFYYMAFIDKIK